MLKRALCLVLWVSAFGCAAAYAAPAADPDDASPYLWKPRVTSVAVFKNGLGFFMREGETRLRDGWCVAGHVPPAAFGTLAVYAHDEGRFVDIVGSGPGEVVEFDGVDAPQDAATVRHRLAESLHLKVQLGYRQASTDRTAAGILRSVGQEYAILEANDQTLAVPVDGVRRLQILELPLRVHVASDEGAPPAKATLGMAYLRKGVTWLPEYTLRIIDDDTAELTLRGTLVNEAEDLIRADVHFVVGVPHFVHTDYLAPIAVGQVIRTVGTAVAPAQIQTQIMNRAAIVSHQERQVDVVTQPVERDGGNLERAVGNLPNMDGAAAADYTVYTRGDLTVRRGEKAIVTLFRRTIRYSHIYRWTIPGDLRHHLVLHNATDTAWTTGPYLAVSPEGRPLSQDLLKYVPRGGAGEAPVTAAINIAREQSETEVERELKAHSPSHNVFLDLVKLRGELMLKNLEPREVTLAITVNVPGMPTEATDDGVVAVDTTKLRLLERSGSVRWTLQLKPGEVKRVGYDYQRYVPSS